MGFFDDLQRELGLGGEHQQEPLMVPPPPDEELKKRLAFIDDQEPAMERARGRTLDFVKDQEPAMQHANDAQSRDVIQRALAQGRAASIPPPPAPPPPAPPEDIAAANRDPRDVIRGAAEAGAVATSQFPPDENLSQRAARVLRQAGRGAGRLHDLAEQPMTFDSRPAAPADDSGPNMSQEPPELASMPKASYNTGSVQQLIARARGAAAPPQAADPAAEALRAKYAKGGAAPESATPEAADAPGRAEATTPTPGAPQEAGREGDPLAALKSRLLSASADPRTEGLRAALEKAAEMKRVAGHITGMGIGADLALGTHVHGNQGKGLEDQADDLVRQQTLPAKFENENRHADLEQAKGLQDLELRGNQDRRAAGAEGRANNADTRAQAAELRASRKGASEQDLNEPSSRVSQNMRAAAESLYPSAWQRIPQRIRDNYSAADVERVFKEVSLKDFAPKGGPSRQDAIAQRQAIQMAYKSKLNEPGSVQAMNDILATLDSGSAPGTGYFMNEGGWQNFLRSPDGQKMRQAIFTVLNPLILKHHGANVTANELERAMGQYGYGNFDDPQTLASGMRRAGEVMEQDQEQELRKLPPTSRKLLEDQQAIEHVDAKKGRLMKGNPEQKLDDSFDVDPRLKPYIGILGLAKKWLSGGGGGGRAGASPEAIDSVLGKMP